MKPTLALLRPAAEALLSLFYPPHCATCLRPVPKGTTLCDPCIAQAPRIEPPFCSTCSQPFKGTVSQPFTCSECKKRRFPFLCAVSRYRSLGTVRELIHRFKYQREFYLRHQLAAWLAESWSDPRILNPPASLLVPVPLHPSRQREREYNQSEELAKLLSKLTAIPLGNCLRRIKPTKTQTQLHRTERMENLRNAFEMRKNTRVKGLHLLLVDDVFTTGSTVAECARILRKTGAASVRVVTVARG